jgi:putative transposase
VGSNKVQENKLYKKQRRSIRLKEYDYSGNGAYFITVCTKNRVPYFEIYPALKNIVQSEWELLAERYPGLTLDAFVIMPNHIHGILLLDTTPPIVGATLEVAHGVGSNSNPAIGQIISAFKSLCVKRWSEKMSQCGNTLKESFWQRNYYDHVIKNETELDLVREYIVYNPDQWSCDNENPEHVNNIDHSKKYQWLEGKKTSCRGDP